MRPALWKQVEQVFEAALERRPESRASFVAQACGGDERLRAEVEALLAADNHARGFIDAPVFRHAAQLVAGDAGDAPEVGRRLGPYEIVREIGRGGMGAVYLASRADGQYHKQVAIKLVKRGMDTEAILRRFSHERRILASLEHPNIARLLDAGTTETGLPYFVMERVEGQPIDIYCDQHRLSITERLKLFRVVCAAVACAHRNLVVHRDLKPSNILVTADGAPKLLDFGIAKLLHAEQAAETTLDQTATALRVMTPAYASPEQARGESVTTATDVYSLGVILYELLTGHRPYRLKGLPPHEAARVVCETEPERPSASAVRAEETEGGDDAGHVTLAPERVSEARAADPGRLRRLLRGDLDNIALKALRKEPGRRYQSVEQFSEDIRRHLARLPVHARKDTFTYRAGKFARRNRAGVAAAALILLSLVGGIVATAWQARMARAERAEAEAQRARAERRFDDVRRLANSFMFEFHDAIRDLDGATPARQLLVNKALEYLDGLAQESGADPSLQRELAVAYERLGQIQGGLYERPAPGGNASAYALHRKALDIREALAANDPSNTQVRNDLATSYMRVGQLLLNAGDVAGAINLQHKALAVREALFAARPSDTAARFALATDYSTLYVYYATNGSYRSAGECLLKAVEIYEALFSADPSNAQFRRTLARNQWFLGDEMWLHGDSARAWESYRRALAICRQWAVEEPSNREARRHLHISYLYLGDMLLRHGDTVEALEHYRRAMQIVEDLLRKDPSEVESRRNSYLLHEKIGNALAAAGDAPGALDHYRRSIAIAEELSAADPLSTLYRRDLGEHYTKAGELLADSDAARALENARRAREAFEPLLERDPNHVEIRRNAAKALLLFARLSVRAGHGAEARRHAERALALQKAEADKPEALGDRVNEYAWSLLTLEPAELRDPRGALVYAARAAELTRENNPDILRSLALAYHLNGETARAAAAATKALALLAPRAPGKARSTLIPELGALIAKSRLASQTPRAK